LQTTETAIRSAADVLTDWLDKRLGATVTENSIFFTLPRYWEEEYHKDMAALNVSIPFVVVTMVAPSFLPSFLP